VIAALGRLRPQAQVLLAAPTGRAAKRLGELTARQARTIHRLLEFSPESGVFQRGEADPLEGKLLVVDEASMLDLYLASALLKAVPAGMQVLFVGDADQLPSVGFGNVFADLIRSASVPVVRLRHVFRQAQQSRIVTNAHLVNQGRMPILERGSDCEFVPIEEEAAVAEYVKTAALAHRDAGRPLEEFNVLTPMRRGEAGVAALNALLQTTLNPPGAGKRELAAGETVLRCGDKVMQVRNNYAKGVFNGDIGVVSAIRLPEDSEEGEDAEEQLVADFDGCLVPYARAELDQLVLAYACTVHKAQGSEYRGVVLLPVVRQHSVMLQRNLLYTAITRAREHAVLVGQAAAIRRAVSNVGSRLRYSRLAERLKATDAPVSRDRGANR
jgi:exodeoxyribonuclease V alpha subunit